MTTELADTAAPEALRASAQVDGEDRTPTPRRLRTVSVLTVLIAAVAFAAAVIGAASTGGPGPHAIDIRGTTVNLYGYGLFREDTWLIGAGNRGTDAAVALLEVPLLLIGLWWARRPSFRGHLVLVASLGFFLYYYASMSLATAYNALFPVYVALFSMSFFAFVVACSAIEVAAVPGHLTQRFPRRTVIGYLVGVALLLSAAWVPAAIGPIFSDTTPELLARYTSGFTWAVDVGLFVPLAVIAAIQLRHRTPWGCTLGVFMVLFGAALGISLLGQGAAQLLGDVPLAPGEKIGMIGGFAVLTATSIALAIVILRRATDTPPGEP